MEFRGQHRRMRGIVNVVVALGLVLGVARAAAAQPVGSLDGINCRDGIGLNGTSDVTVSPDGKFVYTLALNGNAIGVFAHSKATGKLTQLPAPEGCLAATGDGVTCRSAVALEAPRGLAISKNGKHLYVAAADSDAIAIFKRNQTTGALTQLAAPDGCVANDGDGVTCTDAVALNGARGLAQSNNGRHIYVASSLSSGVAAFRRDKTTGEFEQLYYPNACTIETGDNVLCRPGLGLLGARAVTVTKNGKHVYVASYSGDGVAAFVRKR